MAGAPIEIVAVAASAGGITALQKLLESFPRNFPSPVVVVQHLDPRHKSMIAAIMGRATRMRVKQAQSGDVLKPGYVYIAPPDHHLLVQPDKTLLLTQTELVHFVRPSADLLFESVAATYREGALGVILTGTGSDGSMGIRAIKKMGGRIIVQDAATAQYFGMPAAAIATGDVDIVLPLEEVGPTILKMVRHD